MLHVILMILKIIGIVIVSLLGLFLFLLAIVLFVPVRYRIKASKYDSIQANARVSWLCRVVSLRVAYSDKEDNEGGLYYRVKILGFTFLDSKKPKKERVKKVKKTKIKKSEIKNSQDDQVKVKTTKENSTDNARVADPMEARSKAVEIEESKPEQIKSEQVKPEQIKSEQVISEQIKSEQKETPEQTDSNKSETSQNGYNNTANDDKESLFDKITKPFRTFGRKVNNIFLKIQNVWTSLRDKIKHIRNILVNIKSKVSLCKAFLSDEMNKAGITGIFRSLKKWLKHICPYRIKGQIHFGLDDPCNTGYLLGALSMIYPLYADKIQLVPDFTEEVLEGYIDAKGRIRVFTLLVIGIKLILDSNFKMLIKNVKVLKEEF